MRLGVAGGPLGVQISEIAWTPVKWYATKIDCRARTIALRCTSLKLFEMAKNKSGGLGVVGSNPAAPTIKIHINQKDN